ncbi:MAG TPA: PA2169 family four-helix-bundle protein [Edaphobacter sp.]|nr:PA2169 family four-helix-bundle protein [Edaphobacter sp.]
MSTEANDHTISVLNDLIQTCKDGQEGFLAASEGVKNKTLRSLFSQFSLQRAQFAGVLQQEVHRLGGSPENSGTVSGSLHRGWMNIKSVVTGKDETAIIAECERAEDAAREAYENALHEHLPADLRSIVESQFLEVKKAHDKVRSLEVKAKASAR